MVSTLFQLHGSWLYVRQTPLKRKYFTYIFCSLYFPSFFPPLLLFPAVMELASAAASVRMPTWNGGVQSGKNNTPGNKIMSEIFQKSLTACESVERYPREWVEEVATVCVSSHDAGPRHALGRRCWRKKHSWIISCNFDLLPAAIANRSSNTPSCCCCCWGRGEFFCLPPRRPCRSKWY